MWEFEEESFWPLKGLSEKFGNNRIIDAPLAEASIMGIALGAAFGACALYLKSSFPISFGHPSTNSSERPPGHVTGPTERPQVPMVIRMPYGGGIRGDCSTLKT
ncbi:MAG: hypothetical protein CM1200mP27_08570 [Chloroflexota bacterium]|nr:MAG: hypothetical protein CM1200mP27_08570 [Chloroflexota bacterium]